LKYDLFDLEDGHPNKNNKKNKMSSGMGSALGPITAGGGSLYSTDAHYHVL